MPYLIDDKIVINDDSGIIHESFKQVDSILDTVKTVTANDAVVGDAFGFRVAVGSGRIVVGAPYDDDTGTDSGSVYVYDLDGNFITKIAAFDGAANNLFGDAVCVGSGRIVIGSSGDDIGGQNSGSAYVYDLNGNLITKITALDGASGDYFGISVAVGSGRIVIGATGDDDKGSTSGSVYVYDLNGNLITKITALDGASGDFFGDSVAVGSGRIVVGATGDDDKGVSSGSVYVYDLDGNFITKITAFDGAANDYFGISVAVGSGRIVISARGDDDRGADSGSVYIYDLNGILIGKITAFDGFGLQYYGQSISVCSGKIVVGAMQDGVNGLRSGSVYVYDLDGNLIIKISAFDGTANSYFGRSVSINGNRIVVGSSREKSYVYVFSEDHNTYFETLLDSYNFGD